MKALDRFLQHWRFRQARPWIPPGAVVLDIGCHQGEFFDFLGDRIASGVGFDPLATPRQGRISLHPDSFQAPSAFAPASFDVAVLLATLEHIPDKTHLPAELQRLLRPGGRVIVTVPALWVDAIVDVLRFLRLADGMSVEQHHGFQPSAVEPLFCAAGLVLERHIRFQLGLNHLFVFRNPGQPASSHVSA